MAELDGRIPLILDGGASNHGIESTIIKIDPPAGTPKPVITILRPGPITPDDLKEFGVVKHGFKAKHKDGEAADMKIGAGTPKAGLSKWLESHAA